MESGSKDRPGHSEETSFSNNQYHPLAILGCELAECLMALEAGEGLPCQNCSCQLQYHLSTKSGCQNCGCDIPRFNTLINSSITIPLFTSRPMRAQFRGQISAECQRCHRVKLLKHISSKASNFRGIGELCTKCTNFNLGMIDHFEFELCRELIPLPFPEYLELGYESGGSLAERSQVARQVLGELTE